MADIFISYSRKDSEHAASLAERLRASGSDVWMDTASLAAAETWSAEIVDAIKACSTFIVLLSPHSVLSDNVTKEISLASEKKKRIVPIEVEKCELNSAMEYALAGLQKVSLHNEDLLMRSLQKLGIESSLITQTGPKIDSGLLRIAVLPFEDQSPAHDNEWFSDGLTDELISTLGKLEKLFVVDSKSSGMYKGAKLQTKEIASQLGVRYIVHGAVRKAGEKIRINASLIDTSTGATLWDEKFNGTMDDIFEIQEKTALDIAEGLKLKLTKAEVEEIEERGTDNVEAYELYLRSWTSGGNSKEGFLIKIELLRKAIALDPNFAAPYGSLAVTCANYIRSMGRDKEIVALQQEATQKVSQLAPGTRFEYHAVSNLYSVNGETEKAIETAKKMVEVAPKKAIGYGVVGFMYMSNGQYKEAVKYIEQALTINPNLLNDYNNLFSCYNYMGNRSAMVRTLNRASTYYEQFLALHPDEQNWRCTYMIMLETIDRRSDSKREAERLLSMPDIHGSTYSLTAAVFSRQGDVEKAVELLRAAASKGFFDTDDIHTDKDFWKNVHDLPNFQELLVELEATAKESNG